MDTRREFIKKAGLLSGITALNDLLPASIKKAMSILPAPGSSWKDAEHIVILMQENRSFDHCFGKLKGVRGFNDPRAIQLPNGNPVWMQSNKAGETFIPFHLNIKDTKATWMKSLPHTWKDQVGARNDGRYDEWLNEKRNAIAEYADMPLTMGYYDREDIPFYYELADAFTVCDQYFCSSLTGTTPNRLFFWSGTIRAEQNEHSRALVWNDDADYESLLWKTFPEILEENNIPWKFYQNEISVGVGFSEEESAWLSNFGDNPLEFFSQYHVRFNEQHMLEIGKLLKSLPTQISGLEKQLAKLKNGDAKTQEMFKQVDVLKKELEKATAESETYNKLQFDKLSEKQKRIHRNAFVTNSGDQDYHVLEELNYEDHGIPRKLKLPKGDLLYQFRQDVISGNLPTVSWLAAPENLSDHPASAWYGAWYVSEVLDILTQNPEVWKKTIFILTYDENDGYFDHQPPFVAPNPADPESGKTSEGLDSSFEFVSLDQAKERAGFPLAFERESPIGLGYRVPMIVASPWSRGGFVNSEVFDHTSTWQFLEKFILHKTKKNIQTPAMSGWRRAVTGDLTSIFRTEGDDSPAPLSFIKRKPFVESVYNAKFKKLPTDYKALTNAEIKQLNTNLYADRLMPQQEVGIKPSCGLFYDLQANGGLDTHKSAVRIKFTSDKSRFGSDTLGSAFNVYAPGKYLAKTNGSSVFREVQTWAFAVKPGDHLEYSWPVHSFENQIYFLRVYGPNGFFREFRGSAEDPLLDIDSIYDNIHEGPSSLGMLLQMKNNSATSLTVKILDNAYKKATIKKDLTASDTEHGLIEIPLDLSGQYGWYDFTVTVDGYEAFERRFAGRVETGKSGWTDPFMGRVV